MNKDAAIYVAGGGDMVGARLLNILRNRGYTNLLNEAMSQPDLQKRSHVFEFFHDVKPNYVFVTAGKSGGIQANQERPAELMLDNLQIACNVIQAAHSQGVRRLLYLASSCVYPQLAAQPMRPDMLMADRLEPTNASYATAKLAGIELCRAYRHQYGAKFFSVIPANVFGPKDKFDDKDSHVISALIRRTHEAREIGITTVEVWGSGRPKREFLFIDDLCDACLFVMREYDRDDPVNVGSRQVVTIAELAELIKNVVGYEGQVAFDTNRSDGMPSKVLDSTPLFKLGWQPKYQLETGIQLTYESYVEELDIKRSGEPQL